MDDLPSTRAEAEALGGEHCIWNLRVLTVDEHKAKTQKDAQLIARYKRETARGATA